MFVPLENKEETERQFECPIGISQIPLSTGLPLPLVFVQLLIKQKPLSEAFFVTSIIPTPFVQLSYLMANQ